VSFFPNNKSSSKNNYRFNLASLMGLCANNYLLSLKLLAEKLEIDTVRLFSINESLSYRISVEEVTKYTSLIHFKQCDVSKHTSKNIIESSMLPSMVIRLYHDAKVAEVISSQNIKHLKAKYDYPNECMHQQNEKQLTNQFLNDWLIHCLANGQVNFESSWGSS
jgi:hypothetical protein